jgi:hypothetical protein
MPNLTGLRAVALRFSTEAWLFAPAMKTPANHYFIAFGHSLTVQASEPLSIPSQIDKTPRLCNLRAGID